MKGSTTFSLIKNKQILQKITNQVDSFDSNRQNSIMIQSIQSTSKKVQQSLDGIIEDNFNLILNAPTLMPLEIAKASPLEKENNLPGSNTTSLDGAKALMYNYWEKNKKPSKKSSKRTTHKSVSLKNLQSKNESKLPSIAQPNQFKISAFIKAKEKVQEMGIIGPKEVKEDYQITLKIIDFKVQTEEQSFFKFQKVHFKQWEQVQSIIKALQKFAQLYELPVLFVPSQYIFALINRVRMGIKMTPHDLLACCQNAERISQENSSQPGIRFYGKSGTIRACVVIQSHVRKWLEMRRFKKKMHEWKSAMKIQRYYRSLEVKKSFRAKIMENQQKKLQQFNTLQKYFCESFRRNEIKSKIKYEIHIPSHNYSQWQKISMQKYLQKQNTQLCRIFKIAQSNHLNDVRIIYISPINLSKEIVKYYKKLLELAADEELEHKLIILTPDYSQRLPVNLTLTQQLYYSSKTLKKIKSIVKNNYAYIVPSTPSNDYIHICNQLNIPLYSNSPHKLAYLSTKSGCKTFLEQLASGNSGVNVLPYSIDIYSQTSLLNQLTNLIYRYPYLKRWMLKIDNQTQSRGIAYIDVHKILGKLLTKFSEEPKSQEKRVRQQIYSILETSLVQNRQQRIIPLEKECYPDQQEYLKHFYTRGGLIEASINNFESDLENSCFCIDIQPDGEWKFVCSYYKITNKNKTIGAYFDANLIKPLVEIDCIVEKFKREKYFGYFTLEFLSINHQFQKTMKKCDNKIHYLNSIECHLNPYSSAHYLRNLISKDSNALFIPFVQHPAIKELRMQTFFHLCRLQNISFDIQKKIGNVFTFMDGLESGCLGMMTFNEASRQDCYTHTAEVLDFLSSKLRQTTNSKDIPNSFFSIKNAVNGYLNRTKKMKIKTEKALAHA